MPPKDISLSAEERRVFDRLFDNADTEQLGVLTGDKAVPFFEASELPGQVLGEIWALADDENTGFLTKEAFYIVCRLIGYAQRGQQPTQALMKKSGPLPFFKGMHVPGMPEQRPSAPPLGTPQKKAPAPSAGMSITPEDKAKYTRLFYTSQPVNGLLDGEKAREIFTKSRLPNEKLGQIWNLADTQGRGALDATDFVIAMHLIHGSMNGTIPQLPDTLPVSVYAQAAAGVTSGVPSMPTSPIRAQATGSPAPSALYAQPTGSSLLNRTAVGGGALSPAQRGMSLGQSQNAGGWAIDAVEKAQSDQFFDMLDTTRQGVLQGDVAVPFFVQSGLPEETLAQIWDLSDIRKEGSLTKEEFAVARRLVMDVLAGKALPDQLEQSMIPPGLRAIALRMQNQPPQTEVERDLFSLMDDDEPSNLPPAAIASGASAFQQPGARVASPAPIQPTPTGGSARSIPSGMQPVRSGTSSRQDSLHHKSPPPPVPAHRTHSTHNVHPASPTQSNTPGHSFFNSTPVEEKGNQFSSHSIEVGNLQNQVRETQKSVSSLRQERTALSGNVAKTEAEIDELKSALAQAKAAYDTESTNMTNLETRFKTGSEELKKLREELIHAESELSALREQKSETEQNILRDKEEVRELKIKLKASNDEVATLKETLEKLRKEARQQKGLAVVSKKQLATSESDKEKMTKSIAEERENSRAIPAVSPTVIETARAVPLPDSKGASPAASTHSARSMNPFFAHTGAARVTSPLQTSAVPVQESIDADPFGMAPRAVEAPQPQAPAQAPSFGFDDDFGSAFNPPSSTGPTLQDKGKGRAIETAIAEPSTGGNTDFDAAFADFDKPVPNTANTDTAATRDMPASEAPAGAPVDGPAHPEGTAEHDTKSTADQVTNITGSAAVGAAIGALAGAGAVALSQVKDVFGMDETHDAHEKSIATPSSMQPYESRQLPEETDTDDAGDEELAPIRDVEQDESDSDSDSDSETEGTNNAADKSEDDTAGPFASAEDEVEEPAIGALALDEHPKNDAARTDSDIQDGSIHTGQSIASNPFPGAFPSSSRGSRPASSVGEGDENFEDAHTEQHERSASPVQGASVSMFPASGTSTDTSNETEPLKSPEGAAPEGGNVLSTNASKPGSTLGFDDAFDNSFKSSTAAGNDTPAPAGFADQIPSYSESSAATPAVPAHTESSAPPAETSTRTRQSDEFDDFEDLAPAKIEDNTPAAATTSASANAANADFDSNFDDDFGFDNQTFSHSNAQQPVTHSKDGGSSGFDDNFDSAFDTPVSSVPPSASTQAPPALPTRAPIVGFDDDFFASPTEGQGFGSHQQAQPQQYEQGNSQQGVASSGQGSRASYDMSPAGNPPASSHQPQNTPAGGFAPPSGPPPQQRSTQPTAAPTLPTRTTTEPDGDLPQVQELVNMGFNRKQAIAALEDNQFDLERAANALLSVNH